MFLTRVLCVVVMVGVVGSAAKMFLECQQSQCNAHMTCKETWSPRFFSSYRNVSMIKEVSRLFIWFPLLLCLSSSVWQSCVFRVRVFFVLLCLYSGVSLGYWTSYHQFLVQKDCFVAIWIF